MADRIFASSDDRVGWRFLYDRTALPYQEGMWTICREVDPHGIVGVWGYTDFTKTSCQIHYAGATPTWLNRDLLWKAFHVPFEQWGLEVLIGSIASGNEPSLTVAKKLGFAEFAMLPRAHPDGGLVFLRMYREDCRWLELPRRKYG